MSRVRSCLRWILVATFIFTLFPKSIGAFPTYRANFYSAYPQLVGTRVETLTSNDNHCGICHLRFNGGGPRNPYGLAVQGTNKTVAAILALGSQDSDGDGVSNEDELLSLLFFENTPTFPGLLESNLNAVSIVDVNEIEDFITPTPLPATHNELTDGDLSSDRLTPNAFVLAQGDNTFVASQQGDSLGRDIDYFTVQVPEGMQLSSLTLEGYAEPTNLAFLGLQSGSTFTVDASSATAADLLGGTHYGSGDIGQDILATAGALPGATGFTPPLAAGDYTFWLNQTDETSSAILNLVTTPDLGELPEFRRGDVTTTGEVNVTDAIVMLQNIVVGQGELLCLDAADTNDSGTLTIVDAIVLLSEIVLGVIGIADPGINTCGVDPTPDDPLDCASFDPCL